MFDLDAYLARIGLPARVTPDAEGLGRLQREHRLAIPFENLDVRLGRGIAIDTSSVFAKLVTGRRGGYCFEHNRLFMDALAALGFAHRPLLARVWLGAAQVPPRTHTFSLVTIDGREWIADAGFGGSYAPVMPLVDGAEAAAPDGAQFRLERDAEHGWTLNRLGHHGSTDGRATGEGWQRQYSFDVGGVTQGELDAANHWTSTAAESRFTQMTIVSIILPHGFAGLTDRRYHRRAGDNDSVAEITDRRVYRMRLSLMFGIDMSAEEIEALALF